MVGANLPLSVPNGDRIQPVDSMLYLGATVHRNGKFSCELARKIGQASGAYKACTAVWKNRMITMRRKLELLESLVLSKLRYGVACAWLSKSDLRRLDGFHANCLRRLLKIPSAYVSRVSNNRVREIAGQQQLSKSIQTSQLQFLGQVLTNPAKKQLKEAAFHHGDVMTPTTAAFVRRVGRPRQTWTEQVVKVAMGATTGLQQWLQVSQSKQLWDTVIMKK